MAHVAHSFPTQQSLRGSKGSPFPLADSHSKEDEEDEHLDRNILKTNIAFVHQSQSGSRGCFPPIRKQSQRGGKEM
jgi:hypothetical protein